MASSPFLPNESGTIQWYEQSWEICFPIIIGPPILADFPSCKISKANFCDHSFLQN
jgi:hypothetical protein